MAKRQSTDRLLNEAQHAIERHQSEQARVLLEAAARLDKNDPRPWLLLAAIAGSARERDAFLAQADRLKANPLSPAPLRSSVAAPAATIAYPAPVRNRQSGNGLSRVGLLVFLLVALIAGSYLFAQTPVGQALVGNVMGQTAGRPQSSPSTVEIAEAAGDTRSGIGDILFAQAVGSASAPSSLNDTGSTDTFASSNGPASTDETAAEAPLLPEKIVAAGGQELATWTVTPQPTPTLAPTATPTATPEPSPTPVPPPPGSPRPYGVGETEKWIDVNLTTQTLNAYEGDTPVLTTLISSGAWQYATVTGEFRTYLKYETQLMNGYLLGYDYYTPDVPSVMYFYEDYAIHGAYWHNNFGTPVSHGCINATPADAAWLFNWAPLGTFVTVHY